MGDDTPDGDKPDIHDRLAASSLGSPGAVELRSRAGQDLLARVLRRPDEPSEGDS